MTRAAAGASCLVVDDSRTIRHLARRVLEAQGCVVEEAADGLEALTACRSRMPGCVLLDWIMPVMNGMEFLRALRLEFRHDLPAVVFCTVRTGEGLVRQAMDAGARDYITKPYDPALMVARLARRGVL